jgi:serine/threonine-protein kinase
VYSAGILLFECLTGRKPFQSDEAVELLRMQRDSAPPRLRTVPSGAGFSRELEAVLARSLAKSPEERWGSAGELAGALDATPEAAALASLPARARTATAARTGTRRGRGAVLLVAALCIVLVAAWTWRAPIVGALGLDRTTAAVDPSGPVPGIDRVLELVRARRWAQAVHELQALQKRYPDNAYVPFVLGNVYLDQLQAAQGVAAYRQAFRLDPAYRGNAVIIHNAIRLLSIEGQASRAQRFLAEDIGAPAIPALEAARTGRAASVLAELRRRASRE